MHYVTRYPLVSSTPWDKNGGGGKSGEKTARLDHWYLDIYASTSMGRHGRGHLDIFIIGMFCQMFWKISHFSTFS